MPNGTEGLFKCGASNKPIEFSLDQLGTNHMSRVLAPVGCAAIIFADPEDLHRVRVVCEKCVRGNTQETVLETA